MLNEMVLEKDLFKKLSAKSKNLLRKEVLEYRDDLIQIASILAKRDTIPDSITPSHIVEARRMLWKKPAKFSFYDSFLTIGGAFLGVTIPYIIDIYSRNSTINPIVIILGILGGLLLGVGAIGKAKPN